MNESQVVPRRWKIFLYSNLFGNLWSLMKNHHHYNCMCMCVCVCICICIWNNHQIVNFKLNEQKKENINKKCVDQSINHEIIEKPKKTIDQFNSNCYFVVQYRIWYFRVYDDRKFLKRKYLLVIIIYFKI